MMDTVEHVGGSTQVIRTIYIDGKRLRCCVSTAKVMTEAEAVKDAKMLLDDWEDDKRGKVCA